MTTDRRIRSQAVEDDRRAHAFYRFRASDRALAVLNIFGPLTLERLSVELREDPAVVNNWLNKNRRRGYIHLIERGAHRNRRGMRCGKWSVL